jgi:mRNA-degrading endonuclease YafQ of YafQ-DinJ toxin-antitoxin module
MIINYTQRFIRELKKLPPEKQKQAFKVEKIFIRNPFNPSLKTHKLSGELKNYYAFSINYSDRVMFRFITPNEVLFFRIGSHDIYK